MSHTAQLSSVSKPKRRIDAWSSTYSYILAAAAAAIGLGNIWRFPYVLGENGGAWFLFTYFAAIIVLGVPLMIASVAIGRLAKKNPISAFSSLAQENGHSRYWGLVGLLTVSSAFLILSFYSVVTGWVFQYSYFALSGIVSHSDKIALQDLFNQMMQNPWQMLGTGFVVLFLSAMVLRLNIQTGLEKLVKWIFPLFFAALIMLMIYAFTYGDVQSALHFLFSPQGEDFSFKSVLEALGQTFFSLGIASGILVTFGAYLTREIPIYRTSIIVCLLDTAIAVLAGLFIFPILFAYHLAPTQGPSLIFIVLPLSFSHLPYGAFFGIIFFLMLSFAAFTSVVALMEPILFCLKEIVHISREKAAIWVAVATFIASLATVFSFNYLASFHFFGKTLFDCIDYLTANIMLPLGGLMIALFSSWIIPKARMAHALNLEVNHLAFRAWLYATRFIVPVAIVLLASKLIFF